MIPILFFVFSLSVLAFILLVDHVKNRFRHTPASRRVLMIELAFSIAAAAVGVFMLGPSHSWLVRAGIALPAGLFFFILIAFVTVEAWRFKKQGGFDREIARLLRERNQYQEMLDRLTWELADMERQRSLQEDQNKRLEGRCRALEDQLMGWEHAGGGDLRRSMLIEQWSAEYGGLSDEALATQKNEVLGRLAQARGDERGELAALINLVELLQLRRTLSCPDGPLSEVDRRLQQLREARARTERRLEQVKQELRDWQERKTAFLREKILLD